jgi:serine/threonine-protein phosphatase 4 regulatory subunit 1
MKQMPHIALFCKVNWHSRTYAFSKYLLPIVIRYLREPNKEVWETSLEALLALLEQEPIERFDVETKVWPLIKELSAPESDDFMKAEVLPIMCKIAPMVGKDIAECLILPRFCEMCCDYRMLHV